MLLMEYLARELLAEAGLAIPRGVLANPSTDWSGVAFGFPAVLKAQVPAGGRGKAGGIKVVADRNEAREAAKALFALQIKNLSVEKLLLVEKVQVRRELFVSILLDRGLKTPVVLFSTEGGMDIEEIARTRPEKIVRVPVDPAVGIRDYITRYLLDRSGLDAKYFEPLHDVLRRLYNVFWNNDCLVAEINPLMIDTDDRFIAADARINIDDSALPVRHAKIFSLRDVLEHDPRVLEARKYGFLFIPIRPEGSIAIMSNGSGMLMASLDTLQQRGFTARSVLDLGGGATADRIAAGIGIVMTQAGVQGLFANIFGGITRCDEIAAGVRTALEKLDDDQFIIIRMEGTNKARGREILQSVPKHRLVLVDKLSEAAGVMAERMVRA